MLGLALATTLWWSYFDRDDVRAERALAHADERQRVRLGVQAYWLAHFAMISGIVVAAAGVRGVVADLGEELAGDAAWLLSLGVAVYLVGEAAFRWMLRIGPARVTLIADESPVMRFSRSLRGAWMAVALLACSKPDRPPTTKAPETSKAVVDAARVTLTRPTVIAFFLIPPGAVDTMPDLAVEADDWNFSMATLGDSLEASGIGFAMVMQPVIHIDSAAAREVVLTLGPSLSAGYVFVRRGDPPCVRHGGMDQADVLATARRFFARPPSPADTSQRC